jgi:hypothetical protein
LEPLLYPFVIYCHPFDIFGVEAFQNVIFEFKVVQTEAGTETKNDLVKMNIELEILLIINYILEEQLDSELTILEEDFSSLKFYV